MNTERRPAEAFPAGDYIRDELAARGWSIEDAAVRMGGESLVIDDLALRLLIEAPTPGLLLGDDMAFRLAQAFGTSAAVWRNLDRAWQQHAAA